MKARRVLKTAWKGLSKEGYIKWKRSWGFDEKVMFLGKSRYILPLQSEDQVKL